MALRNDLTNQWSRYLKPITLSVNNTYTSDLDYKVTPFKAHRDKNYFDVLIRKQRSKTKNPVHFISFIAISSGTILQVW